MVRIKICGITNLEDALFAVDEGADALGFVFYPKSPRYIQPENAERIIKRLPPFVTPVGVFVNEGLKKILMTVRITGIRCVQLHGDESPELIDRIPLPVIKAIRVKGMDDIEQMKNFNPSSFLLDTYTDAYGGSGKSFDLKIALRAKGFGRIILAGGLTPENVAPAIRRVKPYGVDVSSGVESSPGKKDRKKVREFIRKARTAER